MKFSAVLSALVMGAIVHANPLSTSPKGPPVTIVPFGTSQAEAVKSALAGGGPKTFEVASKSPNTDVTSPLSKRQTAPLLVFCTDSVCSVGCEAFSLNGVPEDECIILPFTAGSVFIDNPSNVALPFIIEISASAQCQILAALPRSNQCFKGAGTTRVAFLP